MWLVPRLHFFLCSNVTSERPLLTTPLKVNLPTSSSLSTPSPCFTDLHIMYHLADTCVKVCVYQDVSSTVKWTGLLHWRLYPQCLEQFLGVYQDVSSPVKWSGLLHWRLYSQCLEQFLARCSCSINICWRNDWMDTWIPCWRSNKEHGNAPRFALLSLFRRENI